jgi:hypothetical protein
MYARLAVTIPVPAVASNSARAPSFPWLAVNRTALTRNYPGRAANIRAAARDSPVGPAEKNTEELHIAAAGFRTAVNGQPNLRAGMNSQARDDDPIPGLADFAQRHPVPGKAGQRRLAKTDELRRNPAPDGGLNPNTEGSAGTQPAVRCGRGKTEAAGAPWQNPGRGVGRNRSFAGAGPARLKAPSENREPDEPWWRPGTGVAPRSDQPTIPSVTGVVEAAESAPHDPGARAARSGCSDPGTTTNTREPDAGAESSGCRGATAGDGDRTRRRK